MRRWIIWSICGCLLCFLPQAVRATGAVTVSIKETIQLQGTDALLQVVWEGKADEAGYIYLPKPKSKTEWQTTTLQGAQLVAMQPEAVVQEGQSLWRWQVTGWQNERQVLTAMFRLPGLLAPKKEEADLEGGPTQRGDLREFAYTFENSLPNAIQQYHVTVEVPKEYEVFKVTAPKQYGQQRSGDITKLEVQIKGKEGGYALLPGKTNQVSFAYLPSRQQYWRLWSGIALVSAACLYYRRNLLK